MSAKKAKKRNILITGISGNLGRILARRLHRDHKVIGVDMRPFKNGPKDITVHHADLRKKRCEDIFRRTRIDAVVHLGLLHNPLLRADEHHSFNIDGTMKVLDYCARYKVPKLVLLSAANIYGARPANPTYLTEDAPLKAGLQYPEIRDLIEVDMLAQSFFWKHSEIETVILRPVFIVGPNMKNAATRYLRLPVIPTLLGFNPMLQLIHEEDVLEAIVLALSEGAKGIFNIVGPGAVPLSEIISELGKKSVPVPHPLAYGIAKRLWRWKLLRLPASELDFVRYICMVDGSRANDILSFKPRYDLRDSIRSVLME